jgi:hypothetical protein
MCFDPLHIFLDFDKVDFDVKNHADVKILKVLSYVKEGRFVIYQSVGIVSAYIVIIIFISFENPSP